MADGGRECAIGGRVGCVPKIVYACARVQFFSTTVHCAGCRSRSRFAKSRSVCIQSRLLSPSMKRLTLNGFTKRGLSMVVVVVVRSRKPATSRTQISSKIACRLISGFFTSSCGEARLSQRRASLTSHDFAILQNGTGLVKTLTRSNYYYVIKMMDESSSAVSIV